MSVYQLCITSGHALALLTCQKTVYIRYEELSIKITVMVKKSNSTCSFVIFYWHERFYRLECLFFLLILTAVNYSQLT